MQYQQLVRVAYIYENWQEYQQIQPENGHMTKIYTGSKIKMAAAAILKYSYDLILI